MYENEIDIFGMKKMLLAGKKKIYNELIYQA
jgi:hypothetical protein